MPRRQDLLSTGPYVLAGKKAAPKRRPVAYRGKVHYCCVPKQVYIFGTRFSHGRYHRNEPVKTTLRSRPSTQRTGVRNRRAKSEVCFAVSVSVQPHSPQVRVLVPLQKIPASWLKTHSPKSCAPVSLSPQRAQVQVWVSPFSSSVQSLQS